MARLGGDTNKNTEHGRLYHGDKTSEYLKEKSRQAVEDYHNMPILFLQIDWENCKRNFYGEMTVKRFVNPKGIQMRGKYEISENDQANQNGIPYKTMKLEVSIFTEQLKELSLEPVRGDYFYVGNRYYQIWNITINDVGPGTLLQRERVKVLYSAFEMDDEAIQKSINDQNPGADFNIQHQTGQVIE
jgi:hypothetical protein